jgi:hypothetical protein
MLQGGMNKAQLSAPVCIPGLHQAGTRAARPMQTNQQLSLLGFIFVKQEFAMFRVSPLHWKIEVCP